MLEGAARFFLGAPQTTALLGLEGETGWLKSHEHSKIALLWLFNRFCRMDCGRLPRHILAACKDLETPFFQHLKQLMADLSFSNEWENLRPVRMGIAIRRIRHGWEDAWREAVPRKVKLDLYSHYKAHHGPSYYMHANIDKPVRSVFSMFLLGSMTLCVETGHMLGERRDECECVLCHQGLVEDQEHFACECPFYQEEREQLLGWLGLDDLRQEDLLGLLRSHEFRFVHYISKIWGKRTEFERRSKILLNLDLI